MSIIVDIVIVGIIAACVAWGYHKGLTESLLKIVSFVLAIVLAFVLFKPVSNLVIEKTDWDENLEKTIRSAVIKEQEDISVEEEENNEETASQDIPDVMMQYIDKTIKEAGDSAKEAIVDSTARNVSVTIINVAVGVGLFIAIRLVLFLLRGVLKLITKLPVIEQFDKTGGIIYGILEALVIIYVVMAVISFATPMLEGTGVIAAIKESFIGSMMYNHNLLFEFIF